MYVLKLINQEKALKVIFSFYVNENSQKERLLLEICWEGNKNNHTELQIAHIPMLNHKTKESKKVHKKQSTIC
jgi:hypothetical protein